MAKIKIGISGYGAEVVIGEVEFEYSSDNDIKDFQQYFIVNGDIVTI